MLHIHPLGTGVVLPAFVIGYENFFSPRSFDDWSDHPEWVMTLDQQAGGYCMRYPFLAGCVLRFCDNAEHCRGNLDLIVRGFKAMAEDPDYELLRRDYPQLAQGVGTHGGTYENSYLKILHHYVERYFEIPRFDFGLEAFVRLQECDLLEVFCGWRVLSAKVREEPSKIYKNEMNFWCDSSNMEALELSAQERFNPAKLQVLLNNGRQFGLGPLRAYLLWENSD